MVKWAAITNQPMYLIGKLAKLIIIRPTCVIYADIFVTKRITVNVMLVDVFIFKFLQTFGRSKSTKKEIGDLTTEKRTTQPKK